MQECYPAAWSACALALFRLLRHGYVSIMRNIVLRSNCSLW
jgi:hypothetical protein